MNTESNDKSYAEAVMNRLRMHYAERTPLPPAAIPKDQEDVVHEDGRTLSLQQLQRLYRDVMTEGYGE